MKIILLLNLLASFLFFNAYGKKPNILFIMSMITLPMPFPLMEVASPRLLPRQTWIAWQKKVLFSKCLLYKFDLLTFPACVLTGQYNHTNGAVDLSGKVMPGKQMLAIEMKNAGYETAMIGKWHLKVEPKDFDYYCVLPGRKISRSILSNTRR